MIDEATGRRRVLLKLSGEAFGGGALGVNPDVVSQIAREIAEANGWSRFLSNSAKIVNILGGYGYRPALASMEDCVASAAAGTVIDRRST